MPRLSTALKFVCTTVACITLSYMSVQQLYPVTENNPPRNKRANYSNQVISFEDSHNGYQSNWRPSYWTLDKGHGLGTSIPKPLTGLIASVEELKGRHSDYITPSCGNATGLPLTTKAEYGFLGPFEYLDNFKNPCWVSESKQLRCVPYFYIIGCTKCGSSDLYHRLRVHPHVRMGVAKEVRWFDRLRFGGIHPKIDKTMPTFDDYLDFFKNGVNWIKSKTKSTTDPTKPFHYNVMVDASPTYYYSSSNWQLVPGNEGCTEPRVTAMSHIHHLWPKTKLVMILRNPVTRVFSTYLYNSRRTDFLGTAEQFDSWVKQDIATLTGCRAKHTMRSCLYDTNMISNYKIQSVLSGIYSRYILDLLKIFPRNQLYILQMEYYSKNVRTTYPDLIQFLELPPLPEKDVDQLAKWRPINKGNNYGKLTKMWDSTRHILEEFYAPFNAEMAAIMEDDRWLYNRTR